jgi:hypothetical protein
VSFTGLAAGDYSVRQTSLPAEFAPGDVTEQAVTVVSGEEVAVAFTVVPAAPTTGTLQILATDESGQALPGTCFDLSGVQAFHVCDDVEGDTDPNPGSMLIDRLPAGEYTVAQSQAPEGYTAADPQTIVLDLAAPAASLTFVNVALPAGVALTNAAIYSDDIGRLWILRPGDTQPIRLDSDERPFDQAVAPVSSFDHASAAFLVNDPQQPSTNLTWLAVKELTLGSVDFGGRRHSKACCLGAGPQRLIARGPGTANRHIQPLLFQYSDVRALRPGFPRGERADNDRFRSPVAGDNTCGTPNDTSRRQRGYMAHRYERSGDVWIG